jgi:hypothetical protein
MLTILAIAFGVMIGLGVIGIGKAMIRDQRAVNARWRAERDKS